MDSFDIVIAGGRCAGAATARLLARAGLRVLVVERASEGSDTVSGHMIKPDGVARLAAWGILPDLLATGCPPIGQAEAVLAGHYLPPRTFPATGPAPLAPRRTILDRLLQDHARHAGALVRCSASFRAWRGGVVTLSDSTVRTRLLIGADGRRSAVARAVAATFTDWRPGRTCAWYGYWDRSPLSDLCAELRPGVFAGAFPTHGGQALAFVQLPVAAWRRGQGDREVRAGLRRCPSVAAALGPAELSGQIVGTRDLPTYFRQAAGPGWALVGDAAHHKDPLAARGIADAFIGAELLAGHVLQGWDSDLDESLRAYSAALTRLLQPTADLNHQLAGLDLPADATLTTWLALAAAEHEVAQAASVVTDPRRGQRL
jgi:2-polyprenyl-6-methoxyphenol hydroxylase-like FAD-dependent oxidoreductase